MNFINHFYKMPNSQWNSLNSFKFFLGSDFFPFEFNLIFLDVLFLNVKEFELLVKLLQSFIEILLLGFPDCFGSGRFDEPFSFHHYVFPEFKNKSNLYENCVISQ